MINELIHQSGLRVLAIAKLSQCEYSLVLYLLNCHASGLDQIISTESELSELLHQKESDITTALDALQKKHVIRIKQAATKNLKIIDHSIALSVELDSIKWQLNSEKTTSNDGAILPLIKYEQSQLELIQTSKDKEKREHKVNLIIKAFYGDQKISKNVQQVSERAANVLLEHYPIDYILLLLKHFQGRLKNLSLLASSWDHYQDTYAHEAHQVDFRSAKAKHDQEDKNLKNIAKKWLKNRKKYKLNDDEVEVLRVIAHHHYPRRQLFWAYRLKEKYKNLEEFFIINHNKMLPITSSGVIVKKPSEE